MELTGAQIVIECLKEQGVDTVFGYPGGAILNVYDELYKHQEIRHILTSGDRYCRHHDADHKAQFYRKGCHKACGHDPQSIPDRTEGASGAGARRYPEGYYGGKDGV